MAFRPCVLQLQVSISVGDSYFARKRRRVSANGKWEHKLFPLHECCISVSFQLWSSHVSHRIKDGEAAASTWLVELFSMKDSLLPEFASIFAQNRLLSTVKANC